MNKKRNKPPGSKPPEPIVDPKEWQLGQIAAGLGELDAGEAVTHERITKWLRSWGQGSEEPPPRPR